MSKKLGHEFHLDFSKLNKKGKLLDQGVNWLAEKGMRDLSQLSDLNKSWEIKLQWSLDTCCEGGVKFIELTIFPRTEMRS